MKFFRSLRKSLYDVSYYHTEGQQYTFWKAVWRYTRLFFLGGLILGSVAAIFLAKVVTKDNIIHVTEVGKTIATQAYPSGLVLDISAESGIVTNSTGPIMFSLSSGEALFSGINFMGWNKSDNTHENDHDEDKIGKVNGGGYDMHSMKEYSNILVIDTNSTGNNESYNTFALLTKTQLVIQAKQNEKRIYDITPALAGKPAIHLTSDIVKGNINTFSTSISNNAGKITSIGYSIAAICGLLVLLFGSFFVGLFTAIALYFYALIVWLISKALKTTYTYQQIYSMSVLGFTLPFCLIFVGSLFKLLVLCIIVGRVLYVYNKKDAVKSIS